MRIVMTTVEKTIHERASIYLFFSTGKNVGGGIFVGVGVFGGRIVTVGIPV